MRQSRGQDQGCRLGRSNASRNGKRSRRPVPDLVPAMPGPGRTLGEAIAWPEEWRTGKDAIRQATALDPARK